jgi:hypothetical protein
VSHPAGAAEQQQAALSRDLADFLIELSIALHKNAIYPEGHPLLDGAVARVERRLTPLLDTRGTLALGVARDQLVIEGIATDAANPLLRELAGKLHRHALGAVRFAQGTTREEIRDFLRAVGGDAWRTGRPLGLAGPEALRQWPNVRLYPLTYGQLELLDEDEAEAAERTDEEGAAGGGAALGRTRAAQLWVGLARAALANDVTAVGDGGEPSEAATDTDPVAVARAIDEPTRDVAYDQVVVGYLLQIAEELKAKRGKEALALQRRISRVVGTLKPETLRRLMDMGGDLPQRRRFVLDASQGLAVDAVVELVQAAADSSKQTISHSMVRLMSKFAQHAEHGAGGARTEADAALREQVQTLLAGWELDDPNPDAYRRVLEGLSRAAPVIETPEHAFPAEAERLLQMSLELGLVHEALLRSVDAFVARGRVASLLEHLEAAPPSPAREAGWERIETPELLRVLLAAPVPDLALIARLTRRIGYAACAPLLDAIERAAEDVEVPGGAAFERAVRELAGVLAVAGPDASAALVARLPGARWRVQRALLAALAQLGEEGVPPPAGFRALELLHHPEAGVRREALRLLVAPPRDGSGADAPEAAGDRDAAVCLALADGDARLVRDGLRAALAHCPPAAVAVLMGRADDEQLPPDLRTLAVRVVAASGAPDVLEWLVRRVAGRRRLWRGVRLAPKTSQVLAGLTALAERWRGDPRAEPVLEAARRSADAEVRLAVTARGRPTVELSAALAVERGVAGDAGRGAGGAGGAVEGVEGAPPTSESMERTDPKGHRSPADATTLAHPAPRAPREEDAA